MTKRTLLKSKLLKRGIAVMLILVFAFSLSSSVFATFQMPTLSETEAFGYIKRGAEHVIKWGFGNTVYEMLIPAGEEILKIVDGAGLIVGSYAEVSALALEGLLKVAFEVEYSDAEIRIEDGMISIYSRTRISPIMTSNTGPVPYRVSASTTFPGFHPFQAFNPNTTTGWLSQTGRFPFPSAIGNEWIKVDLAEQRLANRFSLQNLRNANSSLLAAGSFVDFILQGSNDDSTWSDLHVVTGRNHLNNNQWSTYDVDNPSTYRYYRVLIKKIYQINSGSTNATLGQLILWGMPENPELVFPLPPSLRNLNPEDTVRMTVQPDETITFEVNPDGGGNGGNGGGNINIDLSEILRLLREIRDGIIALPGGLFNYVDRVFWGNFYHEGELRSFWWLISTQFSHIFDILRHLGGEIYSADRRFFEIVESIEKALVSQDGVRTIWHLLEQIRNLLLDISVDLGGRGNDFLLWQRIEDIQNHLRVIAESFENVDIDDNISIDEPDFNNKHNKFIEELEDYFNKMNPQARFRTNFLDLRYELDEKFIFLNIINDEFEQLFDVIQGVEKSENYEEFQEVLSLILYDCYVDYYENSEFNFIEISSFSVAPGNPNPCDYGVCGHDVCPEEPDTPPNQYPPVEYDESMFFINFYDKFGDWDFVTFLIGVLNNNTYTGVAPITLIRFTIVFFAYFGFGIKVLRMIPKIIGGFH